MTPTETLAAKFAVTHNAAFSYDGVVGCDPRLRGQHMKRRELPVAWPSRGRSWRARSSPAVCGASAWDRKSFRRAALSLDGPCSRPTKHQRYNATTLGPSRSRWHDASLRATAPVLALSDVLDVKLTFEHSPWACSLATASTNRMARPSRTDGAGRYLIAPRLHLVPALDPGEGHFQQEGLMRDVIHDARQPQAFGRFLLTLLGCRHAPTPQH